MIPTCFTPRSSAEVTAFAWLNQHAASDDVVLAAVPTGNALPAYTNLRPFMGHGPEALDWPAKTRQVDRYFSGDIPDHARAPPSARFTIRSRFAGPL